MRDQMPKPKGSAQEELYRSMFVEFDPDERDYDTWRDAIYDFFMFDGKDRVIQTAWSVVSSTLGCSIAIGVMHWLGVL